MSRILIAYATGEGQTAKIVASLAETLEELGHSVRLADLSEAAEGPDPAATDAVMLAASVHAGKHQEIALRYARQHGDALQNRVTAFVSVSLSAAATTPPGRQQASKQAETFLKEADWRPDQVELVAGALRVSQLSWFQRLMTRLAQVLFRKELNRLGWPDDLTLEAEFTDWAALRRLAERFAERLTGG